MQNLYHKQYTKYKNMYFHFKKQYGGMNHDSNKDTRNYTADKSLEYGFNEVYNVYEYLINDEQGTPVFYRMINNDEKIMLSGLCDALYIESINEALSEMENEDYQMKDLIQFYVNIKNRMVEYHKLRKPIYYTFREPYIGDDYWQEFREFCLQNQQYGLSQIIDFIKGNYENIHKIDNVDNNPIIINLKSNDSKKIIEVGGHFGCACVWESARSADFVITSSVPDYMKHPNFPPDPKFTHGFIVDYAYINPDITQGHGCLRGANDEICRNFPGNKQILFPKFQKSVLDKILGGEKYDGEYEWVADEFYLS
jgi:hypothetical protein